MSSIRSILEEHTENIWQLFNDKTDIKGDVKPSIDQALKEIEEAINVAKPEKGTGSKEGDDFGEGRNCGINEYQSNLKETLL